MKTPLVQPYLFFKGNCEEALNFYAKSINATVECVMKFKDSPEPCIPENALPGFEDRVMHSSLRIGDDVIMASDGCGDEPAMSGFALSLSVATEEEARSRFNALAEGGKVTMPLSSTFWSPCFGMLEDRYGLGWMIMVAQDCMGGDQKA